MWAEPRSGVPLTARGRRIGGPGSKLRAYPGLPDDLDESTLGARLFPAGPAAPLTKPLPAWATVHRELAPKGVTLVLSGRTRGDPPPPP